MTLAFADGRVRLAAGPGVDAGPGRVLLSAGVWPAGVESHGGPPYRPGAWVPAAPFREPHPDEAAALWAADGPDVVRLVALGEAAVEPLRRLHEGTAPPRPRAYADAVDRLADDLLDRHRVALGPRGPAARTGVAEHPAGRLTLTADPGTGLRIGLHVDSWYAAPLAGRPRSPGRACVNLGRSDRWLLVVNRPLGQLAADLGEGPAARPGAVAEAFLARFPGYPVLRVRVRPGECYLAATENLIHDGSSAGGTAPDLCYTFRGHFAGPS